MPTIEIMPGPERRRRWSDEQKLAILRDAAQPGMTVAFAARRHQVTRQQIYHWRHQFRAGHCGAMVDLASTPAFMPVEVTTNTEPPGEASEATSTVDTKIEIGLRNGRCLRVEPDIDPKMLRRLIAAIEQA